MTASEFWGEADRISRENNMDRILAYMFLMIKQARKKDVEINRKAFEALGKDVELLPGVKTWFKRINEYGKSKGVKIEHYIISSGLKDKPIRFIVDDVVKFVEREIRRGNKYDIIIMDPPSYGRGPNGETWKFEKNIYELVIKCMEILSDEPLLLLINSYTTGISSTVLANILKVTLLEKYPDYEIECGEIGLPITNNNLVLPCGIYGRWEEHTHNFNNYVG